MSLFANILMFFLLIVAAGVIVHDMGIFDEDYIAIPEGGDCAKYTIENLNESIGIGINDTKRPGVLGDFGLTISLIWQGISLFYGMIISLPGLIGTVVRMFGVPIILVTFLGVGVVAKIFYEVAQIVSGKSGKNVE